MFLFIYFNQGIIDLKKPITTEGTINDVNIQQLNEQALKTTGLQVSNLISQVSYIDNYLLNF